MTDTQPIFCCWSAAPFQIPSKAKAYKDPKQSTHDAIYRSFINFSVRRHQSIELSNILIGKTPENTLEFPPMVVVPLPQPAIPAPVLTPETLRKNPLTPQTSYAMHLSCRDDFGPIYWHRYFACPLNLEHDWAEISLEQWFAAGEKFKLKVEIWDLKCEEDSRFFRLTLRPNLGLRENEPVVYGAGS